MGKGIKLVCPKCNYEEPQKVSLIHVYTAGRGVSGGREALAVLTREQEDLSTLPSTTVECPKCGFDKAYWWISQTGGGEEEESTVATLFFKCKSCGYVWREHL